MLQLSFLLLDSFENLLFEWLQIDQEQFNKIMGYIKAGKESSATLVKSWEQIGTKGFFIMPTIFADVQVQLITCFGCHSLFSIWGAD